MTEDGEPAFLRCHCDTLITNDEQGARQLKQHFAEMRRMVGALDADRLMQYAALIALAHAEGNPVDPIMEQARRATSPLEYDALRSFARRTGDWQG